MCRLLVSLIIFGKRQYTALGGTDDQGSEPSELSGPSGGEGTAEECGKPQRSGHQQRRVLHVSSETVRRVGEGVNVRPAGKPSGAQQATGSRMKTRGVCGAKRAAPWNERAERRREGREGWHVLWSAGRCRPGCSRRETLGQAVAWQAAGCTGGGARAAMLPTWQPDHGLPSCQHSYRIQSDSRRGGRRGGGARSGTAGLGLGPGSWQLARCSETEGQEQVIKS